MKFFPIYISILLCSILFFVACNNKKQTQEEQQKDQFEGAYYSAEELKEKAAQDSNFAKSKEYASQMEKAGIEMAKNSGNMIANEKLLLEFEVALKALKQNTEDIKKNPTLSKDVLFVKATQAKAEKVLTYYQSLKKAHLSPDEEQKFYKLNHQ
jgi:hypothetical protein